MAEILIIDDDQDLLESMRIVLESKNYTVRSAESGSEGLNKVKEKKPDLIILDVIMESGDKGFDIAPELKNNPEFSQIPIIMLTSLKEKMGFDFKNEAGDETWLPVDEYCEKPLRPEELLAKVAKLLNK